MNPEDIRRLKMHRTKNPALDHGLWWAIEQHAREQSRSEGSMREPAGPQNLRGTKDPVPAEDAEADLLLDLALAHLHDQHLSLQEVGMISSAMRGVLDDGQPRQVGPVGRRRRVYRFHCHDKALSIRVGEGRIVLPPDRAARLAGARGESNRRRPAGSVAA
jgi:hypothetical protein